ncbi:MAG: acylphosphatase [Lentisphaerae bacterium]|jgi:acylphosphatase|nr:acylphosphatase [Lentisphaerota bacterium]MBT4815042.1 acylphosphatase [Lentisphaerota bacterium]MBT5608456.1 acylphosphatase [Lentisphaerota bacterium]MBT7060294.1 acylphosphatase [Lentisphaerota bacterium]MBT7844007.1 acylphosphatase [Lentisphaerota bacterium]
MSDIARCVRVHGRVTGVGFRYATLRQAGPYGTLKGYVRNVDSFTVECLLQGETGEVQAMVAWLRQGPPSARVTDFQVAEMPLDPELPTFQMTF